jgi:Family of unknown function (DUF6152)
MKAVLIAGFLVLTLLSAAATLSAHHQWPVNRDRLVTVKGTVTEFVWANPHPMITVEVQATGGQREKWLIGGPAINRMESVGWTRTTVKAGDVITGTGYQFADGQKIVRLESVVLANGKEIRVYGR